MYFIEKEADTSQQKGIIPEMRLINILSLFYRPQSEIMPPGFILLATMNNQNASYRTPWLSLKLHSIFFSKRAMEVPILNRFYDGSSLFAEDNWIWYFQSGFENSLPRLISIMIERSVAGDMIIMQIVSQAAKSISFIRAIRDDACGAIIDILARRISW